MRAPLRHNARLCPVATAMPHTDPTAERPPHAPETGWSQRLLGDFHVTGLHWYRLHRWAVKHVPEWLLAPLILLFTTIFSVLIRKIRAAVAANLQTVLGRAGWLERQRRIWRTLYNFAWCLTERYERLVTDRDFTVECEAIEHWRAVAGNGRGFIMVTAHLGLYEVGSMLPAGRDTPHVHLVREPEVDPRAQAFIRETVAAVENEHYTMHFQTGTPLFALALVQALERGEVVAIQGDRPRTGGKSMHVRLFGRDFVLPVGPAVLSRAAGVPMIPVFAIREGRRRFRLVFRPPIRTPRTRNRDQDLQTATAQLAREIEYGIRRAPLQWFVFRDLWPQGDSTLDEEGADRSA